MTRFLLVFLLVAFAAPAAHAAPPVPVSQREKLKSLQTDIKSAEQKQKETQAKAQAAEQELKNTKSQLVDLGKSMQKSERTLNDLESQIAKLEKEQSVLEQKLHENRRSIGNMALGLERVRRLPPEALLARPGAPLQTAQTAMLLADIIPALNRQADLVRADLDNLNDISEKLEKQRSKATEIMASMAVEQEKLEDLAKKRQQLYTSANDDLQEQQASLQRYAEQAKTLQELMSKIEAQEQRTQNQKSPGGSLAFAKSKSLLPQTGSMRLPVAGSVLVRYNEPDNYGAPSKGLTIESRPGGLVVAPMGGIVRFAGPFKNYGNMLIVEHKNGFHSLIAGLEKIDTVVGQSVSAGEPVGYAHEKAANRPASVYYELRQNGKPVNPASIFADLG